MAQDLPSKKQDPIVHKSFWLTLPGFLALLIFGMIGYYIIAAHRAHIAGFFAAFPWILLALLCPLMHLMHGKHHGGNHHHRNKDDSSPKDRE